MYSSAWHVSRRHRQGVNLDPRHVSRRNRQGARWRPPHRCGVEALCLQRLPHRLPRGRRSEGGEEGHLGGRGGEKGLGRRVAVQRSGVTSRSVSRKLIEPPQHLLIHVAVAALFIGAERIAGDQRDFQAKGLYIKSGCDTFRYASKPCLELTSLCQTALLAT